MIEFETNVPTLGSNLSNKKKDSLKPGRTGLDAV